MSQPRERFDLERAIVAWRDRHKNRRNILEQDLLELERHLWDDIESMRADGVSEREAFFQACRRIGDAWESDAEYGKVYWKKISRLGRLRSELAGLFGLLVHYVRSALAGVWRHPGYAAIQILGLAAGLTVSLLLLLYARHELSFDRFHANSDRIVRVVSEIKLPDGGLRRTALSPVPLASALESTVSGIEQTVRLTTGRITIRTRDGVFEQDVLYADPSFLKMFTFPLVAGDADTALDTPGSIVLSESLAARLFGSEEALGASITTIDGTVGSDLVVTGIARAVPAASSIRFDAILPLESLTYIQDQATNWGASSVVTYAELQRPADERLTAALRQFVATHLADRVTDGQKSGSFADVADAWTIIPEALGDVHFSEDVRFSLQPGGNRAYLMILLALAAAVLLVACMNFVTIALGLSSERGREVGMRKVLGARPGQIRAQYWIATCIQATLALLLSASLTVLLVPAFQTIIGAPVSASILLEPGTLLLVGAILVGVGLLAGGYPAFVQARFSPDAVLRSDSLRLSRGRVSGLLMVVQFTIAGVLIIGAITMDRQWRFMQNKDLGYDAENVLVVPPPRGASIEWIERFRSAMASSPSVQVTATVNNSFTRGGMRTDVGHGQNGTSKTWVYFTDDAFTDALQIPVVQGRAFSRERDGAGAPSVLVNRALLRELDLQNPLGERLTIGDNPEIVGVVDDFNFRSLHTVVEPAIIYYSPERSASNILVRTHAGNTSQVLSHIRTTWDELAPDHPLEFYFLEDDLQRQYETEARWNRLIRYATLWSLMLSCAGLFGFAAIAASSRRKETGIRKVLGASVPGLLLANMKAHLRIAVLAFIIAAPLAYMIFSRWLNNFAYRIDMSWWIYVAAAGAMFMAVALTVGYHAVRLATSNPVDVLRSE